MNVTRPAGATNNFLWFFIDASERLRITRPRQWWAPELGKSPIFPDE